MSAIPARVVRLVRERADERCEGCGKWGVWEIHHRKFRSRGGKHTAANCVALCGAGNTSGCHGIAHSPLGPRRGWAVASWEQPEAVVFSHRAHGCVLLDDDGGWTEEVDG